MRLLPTIAFLLCSACTNHPFERTESSTPKPEWHDPCDSVPQAAYSAPEKPKDGLPEVTVESARIRHLKHILLIRRDPNGDVACAAPSSCVEGFEVPSAACRRVKDETQFNRCLLQMGGALPITPEDCLPPVDRER
jgi:hypothetical protein